MKIPIKKGQMYSLNRMINEIMRHSPVKGGNRKLRLKIISNLINREIKTTKNLTETEWWKIRDEAYPDWQEGKWVVCYSFKKKVEKIIEEYVEKEMGIQKLL